VVPVSATLFLDFAGVLHSISGYRDQPFCRLPMLEEVLVDADVDIVISSSWRFQHSLEELKGKLGHLGLWRKVQQSKRHPTLVRGSVRDF